MSVIPRAVPVDDNSSSGMLSLLFLFRPGSQLTLRIDCPAFYAHLTGFTRPGHILLLPPPSEELHSASPSWYLEFVPVGASSSSTKSPTAPSPTTSFLRPRSLSSLSSHSIPAAPPSLPPRPNTRIRISSITSLRKSGGGLGWKSRLVVGAVVGVGGESDGIEVIWNGGEGVEEKRKFWGIVRRDELVSFFLSFFLFLLLR